MSTATAATDGRLTAGTWKIDRVHSHVGFAVKHMVVSTFRSRFEDYDGAAEFHVPHGENHLSELSHALIGVQLGRRIVRQAHKLQARLGQ